MTALGQIGSLSLFSIPIGSMRDRSRELPNTNVRCRAQLHSLVDKALLLGMLRLVEMGLPIRGGGGGAFLSAVSFGEGNELSLQ